MSATNNNNTGITSSTKESGHGTAYEIGVPTEALAVDTIVAEAAQSDTKMIGVSWDITGDTWVDTTGDIAQYISSYKLNVAKGNPFFDWKLEIHNVQIKSFRFFDREGDYYDLGTSQTGHHYVNYTSEYPQIDLIQVKDN